MKERDLLKNSIRQDMPDVEAVRSQCTDRSGLDNAASLNKATNLKISKKRFIAIPIVSCILVLFLTLLLFNEPGYHGAYSNSNPTVSTEQPAFRTDITNKQRTTFEPFFKTEDEANIKRKMVCIADYRYMTPKQLYEHSDLIMIGIFLKNNGSYVLQYGRIKTNAEVIVEKVIKGNAYNKNISVEFSGGIVPFLDYYNSFDEGSQKKMNIDISTIKSSDLIQDDWGESQANPFIGKQYLIFLKKADTDNKYGLVNNGYGMLEIKDDMYFDITSKEWKNISELGKD